jgi:non-canonical (house-cleaning) NTP pyrophosphatase
MTLYLTSTNSDKINATNTLLTKFTFDHVKYVESNSNIEGGQPYGLDETKQGCINRTKQFVNHENFISIENGFVKYSNEQWYDIAFIYIRINNKIYSAWSEKRFFPKEIYNNTKKLIEHFEKKTISRYEQLNNCILSILTTV